MELPNAAERFWIYGTAAMHDAAVLRGALPPTSALAKQLAQLERLLDETVLEAGKPYHDPLAEQRQTDWRRAQASAQRFAGH